MTLIDTNENEKIYFDKVKKDRGDYYVEYYPPIPKYRYANISLVFPNDTNAASVATIMENEVKDWIALYPIPLLASSFDSKGDIYNLSNLRNSNFVMGYYDKEEKGIKLFWKALKDDEIPDDALNISHLKAVYADIPFTTSNELKHKSEKRRKRIKAGWLIVFGWAVLIPVVLAFWDYISPSWVQGLVLIYSLLKAITKALELIRKSPKSKKKIEIEADELRMRHHHYHCEQNPEGFIRLKLENFERWEREKILQEAKSLKVAKLKK